MKSLTKVTEILDCFSRRQPTLSLAEIAERTGQPKGTTHRLLSALKDAGFVRQDGNRRHYRLGLRLFRLGALMAADLDLLRVGGPHAARLADTSGETAHLCLFDGTDVVSIDRREMHRTLNEVTVIEREPPHCTSTGKAILAFLPDDAVERVIAEGLRRFAPNTITDPVRLREDLAAIRVRGYSIDDEERQPGIRCVGAPIRDRRGAVVGSVSATGPAGRFPDSRIPVLAELVVATAGAIGQDLG